MLNDPIVNLVSYIPVVLVLALNTSASIGMYSGAEILLASSKKLEPVSDASLRQTKRRTMVRNPSGRIRFASPSMSLYLDPAIMI